MKTKFLLLILALSFFQTKAQTIKNGDFESWRTEASLNATGWFDSNRNTDVFQVPPNATQVIGSNGTGFAMKIETIAALGDTLFGFFTNTDGDPTAGEGGVPYSQKPTALTGSYKCDLKPGDSAIIILAFKKAGAVVNMEIFKLGGVQAAFTNFSFPITNLGVVPDSMVFAAASSDVLDGVFGLGSSITFDNLAFTGPGITQAIPNGNFESWVTTTRDYANDWFSYGEGTTKTTDRQQGNFAIRLETLYDQGFINSGNITNSNDRGAPYSVSTPDTLSFMYKYTPAGSDSATFFMTLYKNGMGIGGEFRFLEAATNFTKVIIPINTNLQVPDTMQFGFYSSNFNPNLIPGSVLIIDALQLTSAPLSSIGNTKKIVAGNVFPNPSKDEVRFIVQQESMSTLSISIYDVMGNYISSFVQAAHPGSNLVKLNTSNLSAGAYFYRLSTTETTATAQNKFMIIR